MFLLIAHWVSAAQSDVEQKSLDHQGISLWSEILVIIWL